MKGKLPVTEKIVLESAEDQWRLCVRGLVNKLKTSGIIEKEPGMNVRIQLTIHTIIPPECSRWEEFISFDSNHHEEFRESMRRSFQFLHKQINKAVWLFYGHIEGDEKIPVFIVHFQSINLSVYTQKLKDESARLFFPNHPSMN